MLGTEIKTGKHSSTGGSTEGTAVVAAGGAALLVCQPGCKGGRLAVSVLLLRLVCGCQSLLLRLPELGQVGLERLQREMRGQAC